MFERRALERIAINQPAMLCVDGIRGCHPCLVVNLHRDGATLHSSTHHTAAFKFDLSLDGFKTTMRCRVVWRNGNTSGVKFVDQSGAQRTASSEWCGSSGSLIRAAESRERCGRVASRDESAVAGGPAHGPEMLAPIAVMKALNRNGPREAAVGARSPVIGAKSQDTTRRFV